MSVKCTETLQYCAFCKENKIDFRKKYLAYKTPKGPNFQNT